MKSFKVDVSPDMSMYKWLQSQSYDVYSALSEFVDNSIQSYIENEKSIQSVDKEFKKLKIKIIVNSKKSEISIEDNAHGINRKNFQEAIKMGINAPHKSSSLSEFGIGMKTAAIWFSSHWNIETSSLNSEEKLLFEFDLDKLLKNNEKQVSVRSEKEKKEIHYTKIIIKNSKKIENKNYFQNTVIPHLAETYIKFKNVSIDIKYDNKLLPKKWKKKNKAHFTPVNPLNHPLVNSKGNHVGPFKKWKKKIDCNYKNRPIKGFFMIMEKGSYEQPGLRLFRNRRVIEGTIIKPNRPKILFGTSNKYASQRFYGELRLDGFRTNFMKTKIEENLEGLYQKLKENLKKDKYFEQVNNYKPTKMENKQEEISEPPRKEKEFIARKKDGSEKRKKSSTDLIKIPISSEIKEKLEGLEYNKLYHLYNSLCAISLKEHPYLAYIGSWTFFECLSFMMGNKEGCAFDGFYNNKINKWYPKDQNRKRIKDAITQIHSKGNFSKHDYKYQFSDALQLHNEFKVLEKFIIKCIDKSRAKSSE